MSALTRGETPAWGESFDFLARSITRGDGEVNDVSLLRIYFRRRDLERPDGDRQDLHLKRGLGSVDRGRDRCLTGCARRKQPISRNIEQPERRNSAI